MGPAKSGIYGTVSEGKLRGEEISGAASLEFKSTLESLISSSKAKVAVSRKTLSKATLNSNELDEAYQDSGAIISSLLETKYKGKSNGNLSGNSSVVKGKQRVCESERGNLDNKAKLSNGRGLRLKDNSEIDKATWDNLQKRMKEKAQVYAAFKRGDIEDNDNLILVDFDRKWAEREKSDWDSEGDEEELTESENKGRISIGQEPTPETVEIVDEFGRTRHVSKSQARRQLLRSRMLEEDEREGDRFSAIPRQPETLIHGDTIQYAAFNPDEEISRKMEELAAKRDKELTPPPDVHYNASGEIRVKGQGFFQFSVDEETRKVEMANLLEERKDSERIRQEMQQRKAKRRFEMEKRREEIQRRKSMKQADFFLKNLEKTLQSTSSPSSLMFPPPT